MSSSSPVLTVERLFDVKDQVAVVTGGGSGIGGMIATALVRNGAKVYISSRKESQLKEMADSLNAQGPGTCRYFASDLSSRDGCEALASHIKSLETQIHILVNNSGATWGGQWNDFPELEGWDRVMNLNVKSIFYLTAALTELLAQDATNLNPGRVVNISSMAAINPLVVGPLSEDGAGVFSYNTSKAAVNHLTRIQAVHLAPRNVTVNAIMPGIFPSKMTAYGIKTGGDILASSQPTGRFGMAEDMAGLLLFLVSPAAAHITGALIPIDGGATISGAAATRSQNAKL